LADLPPAEERPSLSLRFVAGFLVAAAAATAAATTRASLSEWHRLHSLVRPEIEPGICVLVLGLARPAFARLPLRRQPALDAPPLGVGLPLGTRTLHHFFLAVDAHDEVSDDLI